ncbi:MAG: mechanosensitive ion channel [Planctomycetaceae bacterium]|nr:mechanosensitive ion channel [Planctomycetaceae bacterium]
MVGLLLLLVAHSGWAQDAAPPGSAGAQSSTLPQINASGSTPAAVDPASPNASPSATSPAVPAAQPSATESATDQLTAEELNSQLAKIDAAADLDEPTRERAKGIVRKGLDELRVAADLARQQQAFADSLKTVDQRKLAAEQRQKQQPTVTRPWKLERLDVLERTLAEKQQQLAEKQAQVTQIDNRITSRDERKRQLRQLIADAPNATAKVTSRLQELTTSTDPQLIQEVQKLALQAEQRRLEQELTTARSELALYDAEDAVNLLATERVGPATELAVLTEEVDAWQSLVASKQRADAASRQEKAKELAGPSSQLPEELKTIYASTAKLSGAEIENRTARAEIMSKLEAAKAERVQLEASRRTFEEREKRAAGSTVFGILLRQQRGSLPNVTALRTELAGRVGVLEKAQVEYLDRLDTQRGQPTLEQRITETLTELQGTVSDDDQDADLEAQVRDAWEMQNNSLELALKSDVDLQDALDQLDAEQRRLIQLAQEFLEYIDERVLWIRSHGALTVSGLTADTKGLKGLFARERWQLILSLMWTDLVREPWWYLIFIAVWSALVVTHATQRRAVRQLGGKAASRLNTAMRPTWRALLWTTLLAITLPLPVLFVGWRLSWVAASIKLSEQMWIGDLSQWMLLIGAALLGLEVARNVGRTSGLGESHFGWPQRVVRLLASQIRNFELLSFPIVLMVALLHTLDSDDSSAQLERVFAIAGFFLLALLMHRVVHPVNGITQEWVERHPNGWLAHLSGAWHLFAISVPLILAGLSLWGYHYTSGRLTLKLGQTLLLLFSVLFIRALIIRSLMLRQRRLAIEQARGLRAAAAESRETESGATGPSVTDLSAMSTQTRRLLDTTLVIATLLGMWVIWIDVLPALNYLNRWVLPGTSITYASLVGAILMTALTGTVARNLPGFLEMVLLEKLPLDRSVRYAIAAMTRYTIILVGVLIISEILGIHWENVQWLAAALTFGLGFGLQEIFANFVSGLIILFEQPVRVGDVVTIDGVSGTVSRIRIRSTTITDWDRKEYIVPNKEFITGRLLNWTLTDTVNRIVITVGVAYGSDPNQVRSILMEVVERQPLILREPAPIVTFDGFGDSSLNFTLRAFLPALDQRLPTIDALHSGIYQMLAEAGIEIPFPQRDLHIRSMPVQGSDLLSPLSEKRESLKAVPETE